MFPIDEMILPLSPKSNSLYCECNDRKNIWIYYYHHSKSIFLFDPVSPTIDMVQLLSRIKHDNLYIVLTACQREKKRNINLWKNIFTHIQIIVPDTIFIHGEIVVQLDSIFQFNNDIQILCTYAGGVNSLCMKVHQYLFVGTVLQNFYNEKIDLMKNPLVNEFLSSLANEIIILPSFGPLDIAGSYNGFK